jgi:hypothetical protein
MVRISLMCLALQRTVGMLFLRHKLWSSRLHRHRHIIRVKMAHMGAIHRRREYPLISPACNAPLAARTAGSTHRSYSLLVQLNTSSTLIRTLTTVHANPHSPSTLIRTLTTVHNPDAQVLRFCMARGRLHLRMLLGLPQDFGEILRLASSHR